MTVLQSGSAVLALEFSVEGVRGREDGLGYGLQVVGLALRKLSSVMLFARLRLIPSRSLLAIRRYE